MDISKLVKVISRLTDVNAHTDSVLELAKFLDAADEIAALQAIQQRSLLCGSLSTTDYEQRYAMLNKLLEDFSDKYGRAARDEMYHAF